MADNKRLDVVGLGYGGLLDILGRVRVLREFDFVDEKFLDGHLGLEADTVEDFVAGLALEVKFVRFGRVVTDRADLRVMEVWEGNLRLIGHLIDLVLDMIVPPDVLEVLL